MTFSQLFLQRIQGSIAAIDSIRGQVGAIDELAHLILQRLRSGGTLYTAGNGGSAAQALHLAEELVGRYRSNRPPMRAVCLNADPTALTCIANDFGYEQVFARQCQALLGTNDVLMVLSTSGNSLNLVKAIEAAKHAGTLTIGLLGGDGGACRGICDKSIVIEGENHTRDSAHIQEAHQVVIHLICEAAESANLSHGESHR